MGMVNGHRARCESMQWLRRTDRTPIAQKRATQIALAKAASARGADQAESSRTTRSSRTDDRGPDSTSEDFKEGRRAFMDRKKANRCQGTVITPCNLIFAHQGFSTSPCPIAAAGPTAVRQARRLGGAGDQDRQNRPTPRPIRWAAQPPRFSIPEPASQQAGE